MGDGGRLYSNGLLVLPLGISPTVTIGVMAEGLPGRGGGVVDIGSAAIGDGELGAVGADKQFSPASLGIIRVNWSGLREGIDSAISGKVPLGET